MPIGKPPACDTCRTLHTRDEAADACAVQLEADVALLNSQRVHICNHGRDAGITRETIHALAAVLRIVMANAVAPGERWRGGPR